jgi:acyl-CoA synthetase (AMP-forming)/AMP-acid ligase II
MVTHGNLVANIEQLITAFRFEPGASMTISWLPLWHDMGLILAFGVPILHGDQSAFIDPAAFLMRPVRWLELARSLLDVYTAGPNFGYDYCTRRITDKTSLDLSQVKVFLNGAEPVRPTTIANFTQAFGLPAHTHTPAYGLAEAVVFVTSARVDAAPTVHAFDRDALTAGVLRPSASSTNPIELVSLGPPAGQRLEIVDPGGRPCGPGVVGEVWLSGPNVAAGYWADPKRSAEVFAATLADGTGPWLRTGDLGAWYDGELYLTGRLKDLVIVDGRNHYPQDIEATVEAAHPRLRPGRAAAFSIPGAETEQLVVVIEATGDTDELARAVRAAVQRAHGLHARVELVAPGSIQRTSSGKLARSATRDWFLLSY